MQHGVRENGARQALTRLARAKQGAGPRACAALALLGSLAACGSGDDRVEVTPPAEPPRYAIASAIFGPDTDTTYISLIASLDSAEFDLSKALEIPGNASVAAHGGWLFVSGGDSPTITRYSITPEGAFVNDGTISFVNQDVGEFGLYIDDWGNTFISDHKAYLSNSSTVTIVWDPTTMAITGRIEQPALVRDAALTADGSPGILRGNRLYRTFFWKNWDEYTTLPEQYLAVYDVENDVLLDLVREERCPGMNNNVSQDEAGNIFFSNWVYNVTETLGRGAPKSCALRLNAGAESFDPAWQLVFSDLAGGREGAALSYLKDGQGVFAAFYDENLTIEPDTDFEEMALSANWRLWGVDLESRTAAPLEGVDWLAGGYAVEHVGDRSFLMVPSADYADTSVFELGSGGSVESRMLIPGDSYQILDLRPSP